MQLTPADLRAALVTWIEMGPRVSRPREERLRARRPGLGPAEAARALGEAHRVTEEARALVREFREGRRMEDSIAPTLRERFPWLAPGAVPRERWLRVLSRPAEDLSIRVRGWAYYMDMM